jgi:hypothetical protein
MLSVTHWWQRSCRWITAAEYWCVLTMRTRSLSKRREPLTASLPARPNLWEPLLWKPQAVMVASEVWVCGRSDVNTLRVPDALRSDVSVLGSIRFMSEGFLKGRKVWGHFTYVYGSAYFLISTCGSVKYVSSGRSRSCAGTSYSLAGLLS